MKQVHIDKHGFEKTAALMEKKPESFGEFQGKKCLFGENAPRKQARLQRAGIMKDTNSLRFVSFNSRNELKNYKVMVYGLRYELL
jgi:hypothetical protein